jgi:hypothetical protein
MSFTKELWINTDTRELVEGFLQALAETGITFTQGDVVPLRVYLLKQLTNNQGRPFQNIKLTTEDLKVALGRLDEKATGGTFSLDFDGDDTAAILYNDTAANIETALNALTSITSAGGVTVTGDASGPWTVTFTSVGARSSIIADSSLVTPYSDLIITTVSEGDATTKEIQVLKLKESPVAVQSTFTIIADPVIDVIEVVDGAAGINETQKVKIDQVCQDGSFTLSFDSSSTVIEYAATASDVVTALESTTGIDAGDVAVQKISDIEYNVTFQGSLAGASQDLLIADPSGLIGFSGFEADFNIGSYAVEQLLNGDTQNDEAFFEVELSISGDKTTVLRIPAIIQNDLIDESVTAPPSDGTDWDALLAEKVEGPGSAVDENIMIFDGTTGKLAKDSGFNISDLGDVSGPASSADDNLATFDSTTGKLIQDSGVNISAVTANTAKVTNATHTGDVTGSGALTLESVAITGQSEVTVDDADHVLISDASDSGNLKKVLASDFGGGGGGNFPTSTDSGDKTTAYSIVAGDENTTVVAGSATTADFTITYDLSLWTTAGSLLTIANESSYIVKVLVSNTGTMTIGGGIDKFIGPNGTITMAADTATHVRVVART